MGLFSKKPIQSSSHAPIYTLGDQKTVLLVGLGNPGKEYDGTRHNIGFEILDKFAANNSEFGNWVIKKDLHTAVTSGVLGGIRVILVKPTTYMNDSGRAAQAVQSFYKINNSQTLVIHDELDIIFGQLRTRVGGGTAGHNGLKSLVRHCGPDFGRLRVGINNEHRIKNDEKDFVLKQFSAEEKKLLDDLFRETNALLTEYIHGGKLLADTRSFLI